ncbi:MAG: O-antigen ligase family protein [Aeromicrobium sp.]|nr:O-antigen ligase family protein [Burkholderiales bacterium]
MNSTSASNKLLVAATVVGAFIVAIALGRAAEAFGEAQIMVALVFLFLAVLSLSDSKYAISLVILLLPLSTAQFMPREMMGITGLNPFNVTLVLGATLLLFRYLIHPRQLRLPSPSRYFWLYLGALVFAALHGMTQVDDIPAYFKLLQIISFDSATGYVGEVLFKPLLLVASALLLAIGVRNSRHPTFYLVPLFLSSLLLPLSVIADVVRSREVLSAMVIGGASFSGMHANELGLMFNMALALSLFCLFGQRSRAVKWLLSINAAILLLGMLLTFSRGAYVGFLVILTYFLYRRGSFQMMFVAFLLVPLAVLLTPPAVIERAAIGVGSGDVDAISAGRVDEIWRPLLPDIASSIVLGRGLSSVLWSGAAHDNDFFMTGRIGHPHSAYLGMMLDFGILGGLIVLGFFWHLWKLFLSLAAAHPVPLWRDFFQGASACVLVLLVQGITDDRFSPTVEQCYLWMAYGLALGFVTRSRRYRDRLTRMSASAVLRGNAR